ncbi:MAG TPA: GlmU family protein [Bacteroidota bacterium]|nr:GlmU family protein [Bacteroidota bacterium]
MAAQVCVFEDDFYSHFLPLAYFRPVYNLKCGMTSLREKILRMYPGARISLHCRSYLADYLRLRNPGLLVNEITEDSCLFINGRVVGDEQLSRRIPLRQKNDVAYVNDHQVIAAYVSGQNLRKIKKQLHQLLSIENFDEVPKAGTNVESVSYPWDLVSRNGAEIAKDFEYLRGVRRGKKGLRKAREFRGAYFLHEKNIVVEDGATVAPGVVLDAEEGPIYIGKNARVMPQSTIIGPVAVGEGSWIKVGAQIYENTSIGPVCKVGGEVEGTIIHGYSNKQHAGFLGHSYIGAWVNLGAGTNNSDLKNNYGTVKVSLGNEQIDTGLQFAGLTMGDHSKSAINSMFNTGTVVGVCCNIFGAGFPPKYVPSFSWGAAGETFTSYNIDKAIDVARRVMARRKIQLSPVEDKLFKKIFDLTSDERRRRGMPS